MDHGLDTKSAGVDQKSVDAHVDPGVPGRVFATLSSVFLFLLLLGVVLSRSWVLQSLEEFGVGLPAISVVALNPAFPVAVGVLLALTIAKQFLVKSSQGVVVGNVFSLLAGLMLLAVYLVGVVVPFLLLVDSLS